MLSAQLAKFLRKKRGELSQERYSKKLGISQSTLQRLENADQNTTLDTLQKLIEYYKCDIGDLFKED